MRDGYHSSVLPFVRRCHPEKNSRGLAQRLVIGLTLEKQAKWLKKYIPKYRCLTFYLFGSKGMVFRPCTVLSEIRPPPPPRISRGRLKCLLFCHLSIVGLYEGGSSSFHLPSCTCRPRSARSAPKSLASAWPDSVCFIPPIVTGRWKLEIRCEIRSFLFLSRPRVTMAMDDLSTEGSLIFRCPRPGNTHAPGQTHTPVPTVS